jgi:hypothetical protein
VGASITAYGGETTINASGLVDSHVSEMTPNSSLTVDTLTSGSTVNANNNADETLIINGNYPSDTSAVQNVGTGSRITLDISNDTLSSMSSGTAVTIGAGTTLDKVEASGETVSIGNSADAVVDGANNAVTAGTSCKVDDGGTGNVITCSNATVYVAAGETAVVDGNNDHVVGAGSDKISDTGTGDLIYADNSSITFSGVNTGDVVYGGGDTGTNWYGYIPEGGAYGGFGGGGYYAAVRAVNLAAAQRSSSGDIGLIATPVAAPASASGSNFMKDGLRNSGGSDIASLTDVSREAAVLYGVRPQLSRLPTAVPAASTAASLVQSMAAWGPFTSAFATHDVQGMRNEALEWNDSLSPRTSIARDLAVHTPVALR